MHMVGADPEAANNVAQGKDIEAQDLNDVINLDKNIGVTITNNTTNFPNYKKSQMLKYLLQIFNNIQSSPNDVENNKENILILYVV